MTETVTLRTKDVLTPAQLEVLRERLQAERQRLLAAYHDHAVAGQEIVPEGTEDLVDQATAENDRDALFEISDAEWRQYQEVEEALQRIDKGTFGICEHSGEPIPLERLEALPWARLRAEYQALVEQGLLDELG